MTTISFINNIWEKSNSSVLCIVHTDHYMYIAIFIIHRYYSMATTLEKCGNNTCPTKTNHSFHICIKPVMNKIDSGIYRRRVYLLGIYF